MGGGTPKTQKVGEGGDKGQNAEGTQDIQDDVRTGLPNPENPMIRTPIAETQRDSIGKGGKREGKEDTIGKDSEGSHVPRVEEDRENQEQGPMPRQEYTHPKTVSTQKDMMQTVTLTIPITIPIADLMVTRLIGAGKEEDPRDPEQQNNAELPAPATPAPKRKSTQPLSEKTTSQM